MLNRTLNLFDDLASRGLINQVTNLDGIIRKSNQESIALYAGFDPTADSLHIGSLLPILTLKRFQQAGHKPIVLVGGGTGLIGDPSGKANERTLNSAEIVNQWSNQIKNQLSRFLDFNTDSGNGALLVNNFDWLAQLNVIEFLRDTGKNFTVNYMLAKDSVDSRITKGISFTEFSYMLLQAYDFLKLSQSYNCSLQIGGSDQWGNITAGLELISRMSELEAYGLTIPLVTKSDGQKFGKTEGGTIWLDAKKTSPYQFYQFWINTDDQDVIKYLKYFTFLSIDQIKYYEEEVMQHPENRAAQRILASEVTKLVHGEFALETAIRTTQAFFSGDVQNLTCEEIDEAFKDQPILTIKDINLGLVDLLILTSLASSKRQARQDIESGSISVNGMKTTQIDLSVKNMNFIAGIHIIIRKGKKNYVLIRVESQ